ncbi:NUMOD1 domain-containing DNA-binding protein [Falsihalocynthiibacter arcticus]|uniref:Nuclease-associated modular DNA-binding 1 domain-containing protein n=1 Tax=Falsihalocynthiibacter arcticus TaxID=1579316 RepID=A0A126UVR7_9RHOB|nr:NUMOD1 domain-containing DNA-binding protein [Falsihalocynthiibacter arcticus]AML50168.1 hypothetical protein RC74_01810 [Falsihalocynthiibacter arcticus]
MNDPTRVEISDDDRTEAAKRLRAAATSLRRAAGHVSHTGDTVYLDAFIDQLGIIAHDLKKAASTIEPSTLRGLQQVKTKAIPVTIRDIEYPSMAAAARALHVNISAIRSHLEAGTLDDISAMHTAARAITIRGIEYPSMKAAARALHVRVGTVRKHRDSSTLDNVGLRRRK